MFLKKFLSQPNVVGSVLIALLICAGIVYAFGFNGFNVQTATNGNVDAWLAQTASEGCGGTDDCGSKCTVDGKADKCQGSNCTYSGKRGCKNKPTPHTLDRTGADPDSTQKMHKICSGAIHRIRTYDLNGDALQDKDYDAHTVSTEYLIFIGGYGSTVYTNDYLLGNSIVSGKS